MHRTLGGIVAGTFFVIPSIFVLLGLSYIYAAYGNLPAVTGVLAGFKPVVVAIVVQALLKVGGRALKRRAHLLIAAAAFTAIYLLHVPFPLIIVTAGVTGLIGTRLWPRVFTTITKTNEARAEKESNKEIGNALPLIVDDHAPPPDSRLPTRTSALRILAVGFALWLLPLGVLISWRGWGSLHVQEYRFFTKAALVTFGGAYSVLAYVTQVAAGSYGWITRVQAMDGLALAETTPGPLIMVLQFIGFMAGWNNPQGMNQTVSAVTGGLVTTYTTFLPSFLFILIGAPYIEVLRGNKNLTGALNSITAAVVGVVLNLAIVFGAAVIWPRGLLGGTNWFALAMSSAAFVTLYRFKIDVLWVVITGGLIGLGRLLLFW